jgi:hypothetical protein
LEADPFHESSTSPSPVYPLTFALGSQEPAMQTLVLLFTKGAPQPVQLSRETRQGLQSRPAIRHADLSPQVRIAQGDPSGIGKSPASYGQGGRIGSQGECRCSQMRDMAHLSHQGIMP